MPQKDQIKYGIEILLIFLSIVLGYFNLLSWGESITISLISFLIIENISYNITHHSFSRDTTSFFIKIDQKLDHVVGNISLFKKIHKLEININRMEHPYFKEIIGHKIEKFITDNDQIFSSTHTTSPKSPDTFGTLGLRYTKNNLKCFSSLNDYWDDRRFTDYLKSQKEMAENGIEIKRLFILSDKDKDKTIEEAKLHKSIGIQVRVIDEREITEGLRSRDYLIQDDTLLVDLQGQTKETKHLDTTEIITTHKVDERIREFNQYWHVAKKI